MSCDIVNYILESSSNYLSNADKLSRKKLAQVFTPLEIANYMCSLFPLSNYSTISFLDPGAGSGILTGALCQIALSYENIASIHVDLYEIDSKLIPVLTNNMEHIASVMEENNKAFTYRIYNSNFILANRDVWLTLSPSIQYDFIICNPPYHKLLTDSPEAQIMNSLIKGQPNIFSLFMALAVQLLKPYGTMVSITPRIFCTGKYYQLFRTWLINTVYFKHIHVFESRRSTFPGILQEAIIIKVEKTDRQPKNLMISSTVSGSFKKIDYFTCSYNTVIQEINNNPIIKLPTSFDDLGVQQLVESWPNTFQSLGYKVSTGPIVDFRCKDNLVSNIEDCDISWVPLIWPCNIKSQFVKWPVNHKKKPQGIKEAGVKHLLLSNDNYLIISRLPVVNNQKHLHCSIFLKNAIQTNLIGLENHLNYITKINVSFSTSELFGLYAILNSSLMFRYLTLLKGKSLLNAGDIRTLPMPSIEDIRNIGQVAQSAYNLDEGVCSQILINYFEPVKISGVI